MLYLIKPNVHVHDIFYCVGRAVFKATAGAQCPDFVSRLYREDGCIFRTISSAVSPKSKLSVLASDPISLTKPQSKPNNLSHPHAVHSGMSKGIITNELPDAKEKMTNVSKTGIRDTVTGKAVERQITEINGSDEKQPTNQLESEFNKLLLPYTKELGMTEDDIDDDLAAAQEMMATLRKKGRQDTPRGEAVQRRITDLKRLVELRDLIALEHTKHLEAEFDKLLLPYTKDLAITEDDIDDELSDLQEMMATLRKKGRQDTPRGKVVQRQIVDFKRLVELRHLIVKSRTGADRDTGKERSTATSDC